MSPADAADEVQRSVQAVVHVEEELVEVARGHGRLAFGLSFDGAVFPLHATMDARGADSLTTVWIQPRRPVKKVSTRRR
jgi:hypothetical protein